MKVIFEKVILKNLLSFGNKETTIVFDEGLTLMTGPNGSGKSSSLLDAISFAIYDKPYRKINKADLINRTNKKNMMVDLYFSINDIPYQIKRGMKNKDVDLEFYIDGKKQQLLSSKALTQDELINKIGIDYKLFKQIISLSINHNKSFLTLSASEKRDLLEKFFNVDVLATMAKEAKQELKTLNVKLEISSNNISTLAKFLSEEKLRIKKLTKSKKSFDTDKTAIISDLEDKLITAEGELSDLASSGKKLQKQSAAFAVVDINDIRTRKQELLTEQAVLESTKTSAEKTITYLNSNDICPMCKSELNDDHKKSELSVQNNIVSTCTSDILSIENKLILIEDELSSAVEDSSKLSDLKFSIRELKNKYKIKEVEITNLKKMISDKRDETFVIDIDEMKDHYKEKFNEHKSAVIEHESISSLISKYNIMKDMLSDSGIKSYIFDQLIPILNKNINDYLTTFDLPIYIEFDNKMNDSIKTIKDFKQSVSYYSFSEGEKKKIDMSILLSFIDVTKKIANWNCNLLIIDELLDSSIDDDGLEHLLQSLHTMFEGSPDLGVYIISHRVKAEYKNYFNNTIQVGINPNGFSELIFK